MHPHWPGRRRARAKWKKEVTSRYVVLTIVIATAVARIRLIGKHLLANPADEPLRVFPGGGPAGREFLFQDAAAALPAAAFPVAERTGPAAPAAA